MPQSTDRFATFEDYLTWSNELQHSLEGVYELVDGELQNVPPESEPHIAIANFLQFTLASLGVVPLRLIKTGQCGAFAVSVAQLFA